MSTAPYCWAAPAEAAPFAEQTSPGGMIHQASRPLSTRERADCLFSASKRFDGKLIDGVFAAWRHDNLLASSLCQSRSPDRFLPGLVQDGAIHGAYYVGSKGLQLTYAIAALVDSLSATAAPLTVGVPKAGCRVAVRLLPPLQRLAPYATAAGDAWAKTYATMRAHLYFVAFATAALVGALVGASARLVVVLSLYLFGHAEFFAAARHGLAHVSEAQRFHERRYLQFAAIFAALADVEEESTRLAARLDAFRASDVNGHDDHKQITSTAGRIVGMLGDQASALKQFDSEWAQSYLALCEQGFAVPTRRADAALAPYESLGVFGKNAWQKAYTSGLQSADPGPCASATDGESPFVTEGKRLQNLLLQRPSLNTLLNLSVPTTQLQLKERSKLIAQQQRWTVWLCGIEARFTKGLAPDKAVGGEIRSMGRDSLKNIEALRAELREQWPQEKTS